MSQTPEFRSESEADHHAEHHHADLSVAELHTFPELWLIEFGLLRFALYYKSEGNSYMVETNPVMLGENLSKRELCLINTNFRHAYHTIVETTVPGPVMHMFFEHAHGLMTTLPHIILVRPHMSVHLWKGTERVSSFLVCRFESLIEVALLHSYINMLSTGLSAKKLEFTSSAIFNYQWGQIGKLGVQIGEKVKNHFKLWNFREM